MQPLRFRNPENRTLGMILVLRDIYFTYHYFKVVTGDDCVSVLHPLHCGGWGTHDIALKDYIHGLVSVHVRGFL